MNEGTCSIEGCPKRAHSRSWCPMHYQRWRIYGDPLIKQAPRNYKIRTIGVAQCSTKGCAGLVKARGLCNSHWKRIRKAELMAGQRACPDCGVTKPLAEFPPRATRRCRECNLPREVSNWRSTPQRRFACVTEQLPCVWCGAEFGATGRQTHYCSPECAAAARREFNKKNVQIRRARLMGAAIEDFHKAEIFDRDGWVCGLCDDPIDRALVWPHPRSVSLDHIIPLSVGGAHSRANTQASHLFCNLSKNNRVA